MPLAVSSFFGFDPSAVLNYGISGLGFLLAFLAFKLLSKEQARAAPNDKIIRAIYVFQGFSVFLILVGSFSEWYRTGHSVSAELEATKAKLAALQVEHDARVAGMLLEKSDLEGQLDQSKQEARRLEIKLQAANDFAEKQVQETAKAQESLKAKLRG